MKHVFLLLAVLICLSPMPAIAESPEPFDCLVFGEAGSEEAFSDALALPEGGFLLVGMSDGDAYAVRIDNNRKTVWSEKFEHALSDHDAFISVKALADGRFGMLRRTTQDEDVVSTLLIFSPEGNVESLPLPSETRSFMPDADGLYVISVQAEDSQDAGAIVQRMDWHGETLWSKEYSVDGYAGMSFQHVMLMGERLLVTALGIHNETERYSLMLISIDLHREMTVLHTISVESDVYPAALIPTNDGGALCVGLEPYSDEDGFPLGRKAILIKVDATGRLMYEKELETGGDARVEGVVPLGDGYLILASQNPENCPLMGGCRLFVVSEDGDIVASEDIYERFGNGVELEGIVLDIKGRPYVYGAIMDDAYGGDALFAPVEMPEAGIAF